MPIGILAPQGVFNNSTYYIPTERIDVQRIRLGTLQLYVYVSAAAIIEGHCSDFDQVS